MLQSFVGNPNSENRIDAIDDAVWQRLTVGVSYVQGDFSDRDLFEKLRLTSRATGRLAATAGSISLWPTGLRSHRQQLGHAGLLDEELRDGKPQRWRRVVIEKPFGHSVDSARELKPRITRELREEQIFRIDHFLGKEMVQNIMAFRFANGLQFEVKRPGPVVDLAAVHMDFRYRDWFPREPNVGHETLIYDCMTGDQTLFQRADMVEETWRVVQPVLDTWAAKPPAHFPNYPAGSDGPHVAEMLLQRDGRAWRPV